MPEQIISPPLIDAPLTVEIVDGEIILDGLATIAPSFTSAAARATATPLIDAADRLDRAS